MSDEKGLVVLESGEPVVSTLVLADGFQIPHRNVLNLLKKYEDKFLKMGKLAVQLQASAKNQKIKFFFLNEKQSAFLGTLFKNNDISVSFKERLVNEFFRIRNEMQRLLSQRQNAEWLEKREAGKITRHQQTDTIKEFVAYATSRGSKSAEFYYANITKMQNKALFLLEQKYPNLRNVLNLHQLSVIECADRIVSKALQDGMTRQMPYKEIYQFAKDQVTRFAEVIGPTPVPAFQLEGNAPKQLSLES